MVDIAKLDKALEYIEQHPEEWDQGSWGFRTACRTAGCLAYVTGKLDGAVITWTDELASGYAYVDGIDDMDADIYARRALGLTWDQADVLFAGANTMQALHAIRDALAANPDAPSTTLADVAAQHNPSW